ncbi:Uncharacterized protein APZ42_025260 [Daphnia magna]|uniref:RNA-directed DNA polymerase n=1 Tax=Daphnia magna TaxID=35525 RepID=A0A164TAM2_9CRUS|nr:Uncharacterized protein APZ42_025260 [Daphnia magna]
MRKWLNPREPSCPREPSRRLHPHLYQNQTQSSATTELRPHQPLVFNQLTENQHRTTPAIENNQLSGGIAANLTMAAAVQKFISPPMFKADPGDNASEWLDRFELTARYNRWGNNEMHKNFVMYLEGTARKWYLFTNIANQWEDLPIRPNPVAGQPDLPAAIGLRTQFLQEFQQNNFLMVQEARLRQRIQGIEEDTTTYYYDILHMCHVVDPKMTQAQQLEHLYRGLRPSLLEKIYPLRPASCSKFLELVKIHSEATMLANRRAWSEAVLPLNNSQDGTTQVAFVRAAGGNNTPPIQRNTSDMERMLKELQESVQELKQQQWQKGKPQAKQVSWGSSERVNRTLNGKPVCNFCAKGGHIARYCFANPESYNFRTNTQQGGGPKTNQRQWPVNNLMVSQTQQNRTLEEQQGAPLLVLGMSKLIKEWVTCGTTQVMAIVDTGAAISVISPKLLAATAFIIQPWKGPNILMANGSKAEPLGAAYITVQHRNKRAEGIAVVMQMEEMDLLLGNDFLKQFRRIQIDYTDSETLLTMGDLPLNAIYAQEVEKLAPTSSKLTTAQGLYIPPLSIIHVPTVPTHVTSGSIIVQPSVKLLASKSLSVGNALVSAESGTIPITNFSPKSVWLHEGVTLGTVQTYSEDESGEGTSSAHNITEKEAKAMDPEEASIVPELNDQIAKGLEGSNYFSIMDLQAGYHQISMKKEDRQKTAFVTTDGLYQFKVMPFGLTNGPSTFQRTMDIVLGGLRWTSCLVYLDDIVVYSKTFAGHLKRLRWVLDCLLKAGLRLKLKKCQFAETTLKVLGHIITKDGIGPDPEKLLAVKNFPSCEEGKTTAEKVKRVQSFLGLCSYYRKHIKNFAKIAKPLTLLIKQDTLFVWGKDQKDSFGELKTALLTAPVLAHPDYALPMEIIPDACGYGIGAVLAQKKEGVEHPLAYASRLLSDSEKNYSITEKECLALIWSLTKFRCYVWGCQINITTDHEALCWLLTKKDLAGRLARWSLSLQEYDIQIKYRSGKLHNNADCLSRHPLPGYEDTEEDRCLQIRMLSETAEQLEGKEISNELKEKQKKVKEWKAIIDHLEKGNTAKGRYCLQNNQLYRYKNNNGKIYFRLCVPPEYREKILKSFHDDIIAGHLGIQRTLVKISNRYYWKRMETDVTNYVQTCPSCQGRKGIPDKPAGLLQFPTEELWVTYREARVSVAVVNEKFRLFIEIPIYDHSQQYSLYGLIRLPKATDNGTHGIQFKNLPDFLAVSADLETFMELSAEDIKKCRALDKQLCNFHKGLSKRGARTSCAMALFLDDQERTTMQCQTQFMEWKGPEVAYLGKNRWAFSAAASHEVVFSCPPTMEKQTPRTLQLPATGILEIPPGCTARTEDWILPASLEGQMEFTTKPLQAPTIRSGYANVTLEKTAAVFELPTKNKTELNLISGMLRHNDKTRLSSEMTGQQIRQLLQKAETEKGMETQRYPYELALGLVTLTMIILFIGYHTQQLKTKLEYHEKMDNNCYEIGPMSKQEPEENTMLSP